MRVLMVSHMHLFESPVNRLLGLAAGLVRRGHEVTLLAMPPVQAPGVLASEWDGVRLRFWDWPRQLWRLPAIASGYDVLLVGKAYSSHSLGAYLTSKLRRMPLVIDIDDWDSVGGMYSFPERRFARRIQATFLEEYLLRRATAVTAASVILKQRVEYMGVAAEKVHYIPNGADPKRFCPGDGLAVRQRYGLLDELVVGYGGALLRYGGAVKLLVEIFAKVMEAMPQARFLIVGGGKALEEAKALAQQAGLGPRAVFTGPVPYEEMPRYMAAMDVCVHALRQDAVDVLFNAARNNVKMYEYAAMAKPIVAPDIGEIHRFLHPDAGLLVRSDDPAEYAAAICRLLTDRALAQKLGANARRRVEEFYNWDQLSGLLEEALLRAAGKAPPGGDTPSDSRSAGAAARRGGPSCG